MDRAAVTVPDRGPEVTDTLPLLPQPLGAKHRADVSESQVEASHNVRMDSVDVMRAIFAPKMLTRRAPLDGVFPACDKLTIKLLKETASDRLACKPPILTALLAVLPVPRAIRHSADVSDAHDECSPDVTPNEPVAVKLL
jgi:hypothetical protein